MRFFYKKKLSTKIRSQILEYKQCKVTYCKTEINLLRNLKLYAFLKNA